LKVTWDMDKESDIPASRHQDNRNNFQEEYLTVNKIHKVEVLLFGSYPVNITDQFTGMGASRKMKNKLEEELLESVKQWEAVA
jgi:hypothetical protein